MMASEGGQGSSPYLRYGLAGLLVSAVGTAALYWNLHLKALPASLLAISVVTFLLCRLDKFRAPTEGTERVPERVLLGLGLVGGTLGGLLGMLLFHHKVSKPSFKLKFALAVLVQALIVLAWLKTQALYGRYL